MRGVKVMTIEQERRYYSYDALHHMIKCSDDNDARVPSYSRTDVLMHIENVTSS